MPTPAASAPRVARRASSRVGVGSGDKADDAARVLVVGESGDGDDLAGGEGLVDDVEVIRANHSVITLGATRPVAIPVHRHEADVPGELDGGRQDLRALVGADREGVGSAQDRARNRTVVVGQTRGHIDRNNAARLDGGKPVEELH